MQTFYWFAFWFFFQCLKTVGHPAFLFILRKAGCPFLMSRKQLFRQSNNQTVAEIFERFVASQTAKGVSDKTIQNFYSHLHSLQKHLDFSAPLVTLTKEDLDSMVISIQRSFTRHSSLENILKIFGCRAVRPFSLYSSFPTLGSAKGRISSMRSMRKCENRAFSSS